MKSSVSMIIDRKAFCQDCEKQWDGKNAHAVGAKHADKYKHTVLVDVHIEYVYNYKY